MAVFVNEDSVSVLANGDASACFAIGAKVETLPFLCFLINVRTHSNIMGNICYGDVKVKSASIRFFNIDGIIIITCRFSVNGDIV